MSGDAQPPAAKETQAFAAKLHAPPGLPVHLRDERLTSREAHRNLHGRPPSPQHRKVVDQVAAVLILQSCRRNREEGTRNEGTRE